jgi:3-hydroxy acid dehydrogenase / malonic semialdehyde reductase
VADALRDKTAVVTGASTGIGRALVLRMAERGVRVVAAARSAERLQALEGKTNGAVIAVPTDVASDESVQQLADAVRARLGEVDVVVNNAATGLLGPFVESSPSDWHDMLETNLVGALRVMRALLPAMQQRGRGAVLNVGSSGASGWPYLALYAASKAALLAVTTSIDRECAGSGVRVLSVEIGPTAGTHFGFRFETRHIERAKDLWNESGIAWATDVATPEESAEKILQAWEAVVR